MNAYTAYKSLTTEQKQLLRSKQIEGDHAPDAWLAMLAPVSTYDVAGDKLRKMGVALLVIGFILLFADIFLLMLSPILGIIGLLLAGALLVFGAVVYFQTKKLDLQLDLRQFVLPVVVILREDVAPNQPLHLRMDLRGGTIKEKQTNQSAPYERGTYHKIIDSFYTDPWMDGQALLADGSRLRWKIVDRIRQSQKTKRNARGKYKTKTKTKQKTDLFVQVALPGKRYDLRGGGVPQQNEITVESGDKRSMVKVHRVIQSEGTSTLEPQHLIDTIAEAYKRAVPNPAKS